jgi:hypothetical protein
MREGIDVLGKKACLIEELGSLQVCEATMQRLFGDIGNRMEEGEGQLGTNDRRGLQELLRLGGSRSMRAARTACTVAGT